LHLTSTRALRCIQRLHTFLK